MPPDHPVRKLLNLGISPSLVQVLKSVFTKQRLEYTNICSEYQDWKIGVPQWLIMGSLLWNIWMMISSLTHNALNMQVIPLYTMSSKRLKLTLHTPPHTPCNHQLWRNSPPDCSYLYVCVLQWKLHAAECVWITGRHIHALETYHIQPNYSQRHSYWRCSDSKTARSQVW